MNKHYSASKHLYTLNGSLQLPSHQKLSNANYQDSNEDTFSLQQSQLSNVDDDNTQLSRVMSQNKQLLHMVNELQVRNGQLTDFNLLADRINAKHQEKQKDLIRKLSYLQVANSQLLGQLRKKNQQKEILYREIDQLKEKTRLVVGKMSETKVVNQRVINQRSKIVGLIKGVLEMLEKCQSKQDFLIEQGAICKLLGNQIKDDAVREGIFDLKFELGRLQVVQDKLASTEQELQRCRQQLNKQRGQTKKMLSGYSEKISKMREMYNVLRRKVELQERENQEKLRSVIVEKNQMIESLKGKLRESRIRGGERRSRETKNYIGDGKDYQLSGEDYQGYGLSELDQAIEELQRKILQQINDV